MTIPSLLTQDMIDRYTAAGYWGSMTLADYLDYHAAYRPDSEAVIDPRQRVTFRQLKQATDRIALAMIEMGVRPEDRIGLQTPNWVEYFYVRLACARIGAIPVPLIFSVREHEIEYALKKSRAVGFFFCTDFHGFDYVEMVEGVRSRLPGVKHWVTMPARRADNMACLQDMLDDPIETRFPPGHLLSFHPSANDIQ